jgi:hypothetical protein
LMFYCDEKSVDWQGAAKQVLNKHRTLWSCTKYHHKAPSPTSCMHPVY